MCKSQISRGQNIVHLASDRKLQMLPRSHLKKCSIATMLQLPECLEHSHSDLIYVQCPQFEKPRLTLLYNVYIHVQVNQHLF
jgi:hypothetical protein